MEKKTFGYIDGREVSLYTLKSKDGALEATVSDYGATIIRVRLTLKSGEVRDLVRGYDTLESYMNADGYLGAVVGRVGNRIAVGKFELDGVKYSLYCNNGANHLHGGKIGFDKKIYSVTVLADNKIKLTATSPDGEEGYPGTVEYSVTYTLTDENGLKLDYFATTDKATPINLTNHVYFNLAGKGDVAEHIAWVDADRFIPTDEGLIPTGEIPSVEGTAFDFREMKRIGDALRSGDKDIEIGGGLDHCVVFTDRGEGFFKRVSVLSPDHDVELQMYTDAPAVQFYSGNFLGNPDFPFRGGEAQFKRAAFCLESEAMPDSINHPNFTNTVLRPGEEYKTSTEYRFIAL